MSDQSYEQYEERFNPLNYDRQARRKRKPKVRHIPKQTVQIHELVDEREGLEGGFHITYQPSKHENLWLLDSIRGFYEQSYITDVLAKLRGGKEASVYRCVAHLSTATALLAAKVYRPRMFRNLRNDKQYREGREVLDDAGHTVNLRNRRTRLAMEKKTGFGAWMQHTSWLMHEYTTLQTLYAAGANVPKPYAVADNAILMSYIGDENRAAPTLNTVTLKASEAPFLFKSVLRNIEVLLAHDRIHGDLSAYNILYWDSHITLIDFPQITDLHHNPNASDILKRDITRVCEYFATQGIKSDPEAIFQDLWTRYAQDVNNLLYPE